MLCLKCNERKATVHITSTFRHDDVIETAETIDLCPQCAELGGVGRSDPSRITQEASAGKRCEFCGQAAVTGAMSSTGHPIYWCSDCGRERIRIVAELLMPELIALRRKGFGENVLLSREYQMAQMFDPEQKAKATARNEEAIRLLKERRNRDGRDMKG